jgi:hypothetical protein
MCAGDGDAFREVYRQVHPPLLRYLTVMVGADEAEDAASETWAQACRDLGRFTGDADGFRGWVTTIGRHRALDLLRKRGRRVRADQDLTDVDVVDPCDVEATVVETFGGADRQSPAAAGRGGLAPRRDGPRRPHRGERDGNPARRRTVVGQPRPEDPRAAAGEPPRSCSRRA